VAERIGDVCVVGPVQEAEEPLEDLARSSTAGGDISILRRAVLAG